MCADKMERFTQRARQVLNYAQEEAERLKHSHIGVEHVLLALLREEGGVASRVLRDLGVEYKRVDELVVELTKSGSRKANTSLDLTPATKRALELTVDEARRMGHHYLGTEHLLLGLVRLSEGLVIDILKRLGITPEEVRRQTRRVLQENPVATAQMSSSTSARSNAKTPLIDQLVIDLTQLQIEQKLEPVVGRNEEIRQIFRILSRKKRNNPLIIGRPGVGKTSLVHGMVQQMYTAGINREFRVVQLDLNSLVAGTMYRGQMEERTKRVVEEIKNSDTLLFVDDIHEQIRIGSEALEIIQVALARGEIQLISTMSYDEYDRYYKTQALVTRFFAPLFIREMNDESIIEALKALRPEYESHHQIVISDEALENIVSLTNNFIKDRYQPDKSIQVMDEVAADIAIERTSTLNKESLELRDYIIELREIERDARKSGDSSEYADAIKSIAQLESEMYVSPENYQLVMKRGDIVKWFVNYTGLSQDELLTRVKRQDSSLSDLVRSRSVPDIDSSRENLYLGEAFAEKYDVIGLVGRGGFGEVWQVVNRILDRVEAVKVIPPLLIQTNRLARQFQNEARMAARLNHPNIVTIYDTFQEDSHVYFTMEYVDGVNLHQILDEKNYLPVDQVREIAVQLCDALDYAHSNGTIHGDIKPSNILLHGNRVKLVDFGVSVLVKETMTETTGMRGGTPSYRSPEQILGRKPDARADIYSIGVTLYELLTGQRPFQGMSVEYLHLNETPLPPSHINWEILPSVDEIVLKCLNKNPATRFQTAQELGEAWRNLPQPVSLTPLVNLMRVRKKANEPPYVLVLGGGCSLSSGCASMAQMVETIAMETGDRSLKLSNWDSKLVHFLNFVEGLSPTERYSLLKKYFEGIQPSIGYMRLASLVKSGYFDLVFTSNLDVMLEEAMRIIEMPIQDYQIINIDDTTSMITVRELLKSPSPRVKIVKLHGDIRMRRFVFTPREASSRAEMLRGLLEEYFERDMIMVGQEENRDEAIARCLGSSEGSLWYVHPRSAGQDASTSRIPRFTRSQSIFGDNGYFDRFFALLAGELNPKE